MSKPEIVATARKIRSDDPNALFAEFGVFDTARTIADGTQLIRLTDHEAAMAWLTPEFPPRPPEGFGLPRYGLRWNGPAQPLAVPFDDGYWTPWHLADHLQAERGALLGLLRDVREKACYSVGEAEELSRQMHLIRETIDATLAKHSA